MRLLLLNVVFVVIDVAESPGFSLHCPEAVEAVAGQNVTLWCSIISTKEPGKVEWTVNSTKCDVYLYLLDKDWKEQCEEYKGNTSHFLDELPLQWNSSLRLTTQLSHSGKYRCSVRVGDETQNCFINLTVHQRGDPLQDNTTENPTVVDSPGNSTFTDKVGIGVGITITIVLLIIGVIWFLHKKCNQRQRRQNPDQNNEPDDPAEEPMNPNGNGEEIEMRNM